MISERKILDYAVNWDNSNGTDCDKVFGKYDLVLAYHYYQGLPDTVPYKNLTVDVAGEGTLTVLSSTGTDNIDRYGLRHLIW